MQQYFINETTDINSTIIFNNEQSHHIAHVLRMKVSDKVIVATVDKKRFIVEITEIGNNVNARCIERINDNTSSCDVVLVLALLKKEKWDYALQKAAELGATKIVPLITSRTVVKLNDEKSDKKLARWNKIVLEACEQSLRGDLCEVLNPIVINEINDYTQDVNLVAYEKEDSSFNIGKYVIKDKSVMIVIGPEGGFDNSEIEKMRNMGIDGCSLGNSILRAETACLYALSIIKHINEV